MKEARMLEVLEEWAKNRIHPSLLNKAAEKWHSGALDTEGINENDMTVLKALVYVCLDEIREEFRPLSREGQEMTKNLQHF